MRLASWVICAGLAVAVAVSRADAEPRLRVAGAKDGAIALVVRDGLALKRTIRILADTAEPAGSVVVTLSPFEEPGGEQGLAEPARWTFERISLDEPAAIELAVTFPRPGKYAAELDVIVNGARATTRLEAEVVAQALGLQVPPSVAIRGEVGGSREVTLAVRETGGREHTLLEPRVTASIRSGDRSYQIPARVVGVKRNGAVVRGNLKIKKGEDARIAVELGGLDAPGEYDGAIRLLAEGAEPVDVPFTATVKEPMLFAILSIGAGVLISTLVRLWYRRWRTRLEARRSLALLDERLGAIEPRAASDEGRAVVRILRSHVGELRTQLAVDDPPADLPAVILRISAKLAVAEAWLEADRMVAGLPGGDTRIALRGKLDDAAATLGRREADDAAIAAAGAAVGDLKIREKWRGAVAAEVERVRQAVEQARKAAPGAIGARIAGGIDPRLQQAERLLAEDALEKLAGDTGELAQLQRKLGEVLVEALRAVLAGEPPAFMDEPAWQAHREAVGRQLKGLTLEAYRAGLAAHIIGLARALAARARTDAAAAEEQGYGETAAALRQLADGLDGMAQGATADDVTALAELYETELAKWPRLAGKARGMDTRGKNVTPLPELLGSLPAAVLRVIPLVTSQAPTGASGISRLLAGAELIVFVVLFAVAVVTGLNLLWTDDATWGGSKAHLMAFLWGFGLHQVGASPTLDLLGLRERLSATAGGA
ncbi:MAG TPA: hypothetical protein VK932_19725 [Kofleriaceae bacterium]|nr:hypothetical protein [Kofleriaceae bacterium]